jgi:YfiH family protein
MNQFIAPPNFTFPDISAFFTTKTLGDNAKKIEVVSKELNIPADRIYLPTQKHTSDIHVLGPDLRQSVADAVVTDKRGILIGVLVADCVPILLYDPGRKITGAVHAGWRGTAAQILKNALSVMQETYDSVSADVLVAIGPSIRQCSYEVGAEVKIAVESATGEGDYYHGHGDKYFIDIAAANKRQALAMGVPEKNIWESEECTFCNPDKYYSYRYSGVHAGRQGGFIVMW